jgi:hypothetical protein
MKKEIALELPINYPKALLTPFEDELDKFAVAIKSRERNLGTMAAIEWTIPTQIIIYLAGAFITSFLAESGKDAYKGVRNALKKFIINNHAIKTKLITASDSSDKLSKSYDQSLSISMRVKLHQRIALTVLFPGSMPKEEADTMLDGLFDSLRSMKKDLSAENDQNLQGPQIQLFLIADPDKKSWMMLDHKQMMDKYRNKS